MVIAIDGPSGSGKSTIARAVAAALGYGYLNTGAYYRAATIAALRSGADPTDSDAVVPAVAGADFDFDGERMLLDGEDVSEATRAAEVTANVSLVSAVPEVRRIMVDQQRAWVERHSGRAVVEGRDIGTVVFPDAGVKVFLTASEEERARRRSLDAESRGQRPETIVELIRRRDEIDSTREVSPLTPAEDAVEIDTTSHDVEAVVAIVLRLVDPA
jgi:cytidylate kinase